MQSTTVHDTEIARKVFLASAIEAASLLAILLFFFYQVAVGPSAAWGFLPLFSVAFGYLGFAVYYRRVLRYMYPARMGSTSNPFLAQRILAVETVLSPRIVDLLLMVSLLAWLLIGTWIYRWIPLAALIVIMIGASSNDWVYEIGSLRGTVPRRVRRRLLFLWLLFSISPASQWVVPSLVSVLRGSGLDQAAVLFLAPLVAYGPSLIVFSLVWRGHMAVSQPPRREVFED